MRRKGGLEEALGVDLGRLAQQDLAPVEVAVLDTGVDGTHPDLAGRVSEVFQIERDGPRYRAAALTPGANNDKHGHGTAVASVIAGTAPNARIIDIQVIGASEEETAQALVEAFRFSVLRRFRIVNFSLTCEDRLLIDVMRLCEQAYWQEQVVVAARRNTVLLEHGLPAQLSSCLGVDCGRFDSPLGFAFREQHPVEFIAHGEQVRVAVPGGGHSTRTGTSYAAPAFAALCAMLLGAFPGLTPFEVKSVMKNCANRGKHSSRPRPSSIPS